jgi:signal transduction histidine kinase/ActR/RegA family two-component response regulator
MFATHRPVLCRDIQSRDGCENDVLREAGLRACLVVPVRLWHQTVGALYLGDPEAREFTPDEVAAVQVLASLLALGMENNRLYAEVRTAFEGMASAQDQLVQTEKARAVGAMAGGIANEFNNVLAIVLGKTQLMLTRAPDGPLREGLGAVEEAAWRAADIVRRLQGFAPTSIDDGTGPVDLAAVVQDAIAMTRSLWKDEAEARGVPIDVVTDLDRVPPIEGQAVALREAVMNLILNAVDAMPRGGRLGLTIRRVDTGVELHVSDGGEGMPEDVRRRIFDPFFTTRAPHRTGLGLSVVYGVVNNHRGFVQVDTEPDVGTIFSIYLPLASSEHYAGTRPLDRRKTRAPQTILLVEDEEMLRDLGAQILEGEGYRVLSAKDGEEAVETFTLHRDEIGLVVCDLGLPKLGGREVFMKMKRSKPSVRAIVASGYLDPAIRSEILKAGVLDCIQKPYDFRELVGKIRSVIGKAHSEDDHPQLF